MKLSAITYSSLLGTVSACGGTVPLAIRRMHSAAGMSLLARQAPLETPTNQDNRTHWTVDQNKRQMQVSDDAFNARDLARFNHAANIKVYQGASIRNLEQHLSDIQLVYSNLDIKLHNHDYKVWFGEGDWTVAVETVTGIQNGPQQSLDGGYLPPTNKPQQYDLMTIARWNNGWMEEEYLYSDDVLSYRQIGLLPDKPADNLPDLELGPASPLGNGNSTANKAALTGSLDAINQGNISSSGLKLASNATIYGLSDQPLDAQGYIQWLNGLRTAFPDLRFQNRQMVAQGDWTASVDMLSGTQRGSLTLPKYIAEQPIAATNMTVQLLHYTIARWSQEQIVELRVNFDTFGLLGALNVTL